MKRFLLALPLLGLLCLPADSFYQSRDSNYNIAISGGGGGTVTWSGQVSAFNTGCSFLSTCTTTTAVTVPSGYDVFVVSGPNEAVGASSISGLTLNSPCSGTLTAIQTLSVSPNQEMVTLFAGTVTGGSCTMQATATGTGAFFQLTISLGALNNLNSTTPLASCSTYFAATQASPYECASPISTTTGGFIIGGIGAAVNATVLTDTLTVDSTTPQSNSTSAIGNSTSTSAINPGQGAGNTLQVGVVAGAWR